MMIPAMMMMLSMITMMMIMMMKRMMMIISAPVSHPLEAVSGSHRSSPANESKTS